MSNNKPLTSGLQQTVDLKTKDKEGNVIEHLRIHPDGREEVITDGNTD